MSVKVLHHIGKGKTKMSILEDPCRALTEDFPLTLIIVCWLADTYMEVECFFVTKQLNRSSVYTYDVGRNHEQIN